MYTESRAKVEASRLKCAHILAVFLSLVLLAAPLGAQDTGLSVSKWVWNDGHTIPHGKDMSSVSITVSNEGKKQLKLEFVGLHFAWMPENAYAYGGGSEKTNVLVPGQSVTYTIAFGIPKDISPGSYDCYAAIIYHMANDSAWTKISSAYSPPQRLEIVPMVVVTVTSTATVAQPSDWTVDFALLVAFTIVGLALLATFRSARRRKEEPVEK